MLLYCISFIVAWVAVQFYRPRSGVLACGIAGFNGPRPVDETKLRWLLVENQIRGSDSTGVYGNHLFKDSVTAKTFIKMLGYKAATKGAKNVIGHTRAGTYGAKTAENAHPFYYSDGALVSKDNPAKDEWACVGIHNGFIVEPMLKHHTDELGFTEPFSVDSQIIFAAISKHKNINIISQIEGAMTLAFILPNKDPKTLYLYKRANTRCLHIGESSDGIYFSSEAEPLSFIGCSGIWEAGPNILYTFRDGQLIDRYRMPDPILKSLAVNVSRSGWRQGLPIAEINALPLSAGILKANTAYESAHIRGKGTQADLKLYDDSGSSKKRLLENYHGINKVSNSSDETTARFYMLIRSIREELKAMNVTPVTFTKSNSFALDDPGTCLLCIKVISAETGRGMGAWSVLHQHDIELAGMTTLNGLSIMKVPGRFCETEQTFLVYDPVEAFGPWSVTITPQRGRMMEVILALPFRQNEHEERGETSTVCEFERNPNSNGGGWEKHSVCIVRPKSGVLYGTTEDEDNGDIRVEETSISGRYKKAQTSGMQGRQFHESLPQTDIPGVTDLEVIKYKLFPFVEPKVRDIMFNHISAKDKSTGTYTNWTPEIKLWSPLVNSSTYKNWQQIYNNNFAGKIYFTLLLWEACRLQCWDRLQHKSWMRLPIYIETLLLHYWSSYLTPKALADGYFDYKSILPSTLIAKVLGGTSVGPMPAASDLIFQERPKKGVSDIFPTFKDGKMGYTTFDKPIVKQDTTPSYLKKNIEKLSYRDYITFLEWGFDPKIIDDMDKTRMKNFYESLNSYKHTLEKVIEKANDALRLSENNSSVEAVELRASLIETRNVIKSEKEDLDDLVSVTSYRLGLVHHVDTEAPDEYRVQE